MKNILLTILASYLLCSCASMQPQIPPNRIETKYSSLINKYDLDIDEHRCLFAPNYHIDKEIKPVSIILSPKEMKIFNYKIENKISEIYTRTNLISSRYKIIAKSKVTHLKHLSKMISQNQDSVFDSLEKQIDIPKALAHFERIDKLVEDLPIFIPVKNALISSKFGWRKLKNRKRSLHKGLDIVGPKGSKIYAAGSGKILEVAYSKSYGNYILIQHKKNLKTRYAHLKTLGVRSGQRVAQGQYIGIQGSTGRSSRDHLHFEVIHKSRHLNPFNFVGREVGCHRV